MATSSSSTAPSDCIKAIQHYVNKILKPKDKTKEITGMKCLLLDKETVSNSTIYIYICKSKLNVR